MRLQQIGWVHSPHQQASGTPVQSAYASGATGHVEVFLPFAAGLKDLEAFERIWLLYWFDRATASRLEVVPYLDPEPHGIFATRSPCRPNPIGMSPVRLLGIEGNVLRVAELDILDRTPLLDIKPYVPPFDAFAATRIGWCERIKTQTPKTADARFEAQLRLRARSRTATDPHLPRGNCHLSSDIPSEPDWPQKGAKRLKRPKLRG